MKSALRCLVWFACAGQLAAADFVVTNTDSSGPGSLYQAITDANNTPGADRILFNIPGTGVHKIGVGTNPLPIVTDSLTIDGYSQPGAKPNSLTVGDNAVILVQIAGPGALSSSVAGLVFSGPSSDYIVRGLCLTGFGTRDRQATGVAITAGAVHSVVVAGNFIGVLPDGETAVGNGIAVGHVSQLGGTDAASRNIISGNVVGLAGTRTAGAVVQGNYIGTNASGTRAIPNSEGISLAGGDTGESSCTGAPDPDQSKTIIGGTAAGAANVVSGNGTAIALGGLYVCGRGFALPALIRGVRIQGNLIGVQADGVSPLHNGSGVRIGAGTDNVIGGFEPGAGNVIAFNDSGVTVADVAVYNVKPNLRNQILSNSIFANRIGIDLGGDGRTPNDAGDADEGANNLQNYPVIESASVAHGSATISGLLNSTANTQFTLQYFSESADLASPVQRYLGSNTVTTGASGNAQFSATFPASDTSVGFNMTATSQDGNTSEFSRVPPRLRNISTRAFVGTGDQVTIAGFIFSSSVLSSPVVVRALGPSLQRAFPPVAGALPDPTLELHTRVTLNTGETDTVIGSNDNWADDSNAANVSSAGLAPTHSLESALWKRFVGGNYTAVVAGAGGTTGVGLVEVYDIGDAQAELLNISTRGFVGSADNVLIAGTILEDISGSTRIVARALGPSLSAAGVRDVLADPILELRDGQGALIASNDNWRDGQPDALTAVGLAPSNDSESAIFMRLTSGAYTAIVRGKGDSTGTALIELYNQH